MNVKSPKYIEISPRLLHDTQLMLAYALKSDAEAGGFLIRAKHGHLGVIAEQFGEDREIIIEPNEEMYEGEVYYGTVHVHPKTDTFSVGDISSYLADNTELIMFLSGADGSTNIAIKVPGVTKEGEFRKELETNYPQHDIVDGKSGFQNALSQVSDDYGFLYYRAEPNQETKLALQNSKPSSDTVVPIEQLVDELGLEGLDVLPEDLSSKKYPKKDKTQETNVLEPIEPFIQSVDVFLNSQLDMIAAGYDVANTLQDPSLKTYLEQINADLIRATEKVRYLVEMARKGQISKIAGN